MPVLANNAASRLAASIGASDTSISLQSGTGSQFPLPVDDWFPIMFIKASGEYEIARCTARSGDVLTVLRAQEGTASKTFSAGDRVELRLTAAAVVALLEQTRQAAQLSFTPVQQGGGASQGSNKIHIGWSGSGLKAQVDALDYGTLWSTYNFNPANYLPVGGGTMTGNYTIQNTSPQITFSDTDWGLRHLHCNSGLVGFLTSVGGWACYSDNSGNFLATGNVGAYSDRKFKTAIRSIDDGLALVEQLRGVRYVDRRSGAERVGVIAQEVQAVLPEVVVETPEGLAVDYGNLVAPLISAIRELAARVRRLEYA